MRQQLFNKEEEEPLEERIKRIISKLLSSKGEHIGDEMYVVKIVVNLLGAATSRTQTFRNRAGVKGQALWNGPNIPKKIVRKIVNYFACASVGQPFCGRIHKWSSLCYAPGHWCHEQHFEEGLGKGYLQISTVSWTLTFDWRAR